MERHGKMMMVSWGKFAAMIATSVIAMFFLMYQLVYSFEHVTFSTNRLVSSLVMGSVMTLIMLGFMWKMIEGVAIKAAVLVGAVVVGIAILAINRDQTLIGDEAFMKSMIPHHSIAINNARKSDIRDPRVRRLANQIIESQVEEITEMQWLLQDIDANGHLGDETLARIPAVVTPEMRAKIEQNIESATPSPSQR
jgi:hypothetical protein